MAHLHPPVYRATVRQRAFHAVVTTLMRAGIKLGPFARLTVAGRTTGKRHTIPVAPLTRNGRGWLVSPYGTVNWVRNARAAQVVTLRRGRVRETLGICVVSPAESAPILKEYLARFPIVHPYFAASTQSPLEAFMAEAPRHPTFELLPRAG
jgi:deazaflavin-dependent oxidoreductase (nitroreductase family)